MPINAVRRRYALLQFVLQTGVTRFVIPVSLYGTAVHLEIDTTDTNLYSLEASKTTQSGYNERSSNGRDD